MPLNIKTYAFNIRVTPLWFANKDIQFILDPYATTSYCTSYMNIIFSKKLYHSSWTFKFVNIYLYHEHVFVLKS
jgi:hypothetical protein